MPDFIFLMHANPDAPDTSEQWDTYLEQLGASGVLRGGSAIGAGICVSRGEAAPAATAHINGFIRIEALDLAHARELVIGNPVYEAGGTVEIRELPRTD
jgi:hypothetical protein